MLGEISKGLYVSLRYAIGIPEVEVMQAHQLVKEELIGHVNRGTGTGMGGECICS